MKKGKLLGIGAAVTMAAGMLAGCTGTTTSGGSTADSSSQAQAAEGKTLRIYCWNDEFQSRVEEFYPGYDKNTSKIGDVTVEWVITPNENNAYQNKLDTDLQAQSGSSDPIDIFLIEADYASKYVDSDYSLNVKADIGLTDSDLSNQYKYTQDIATVDGKLKGVTWQATPGLFAYRRSIAKAVLGTDDPDKVQEALSSWDKFNDVAKKAADKGYKMLSGYDDSYRVFSNNSSAPWVNDKSQIVIDNNLMKWVDQTKTFTDKAYNNKTSLWDDQWAADQGPKGKVFGFFYSTWGINFTLLGNSLATPVDKGGKEEVGNGIYGDYAVCSGPQSYYWGGSWIVGAKGTDNLSLVKDIMKKLTCDKAVMKSITEKTQDYTNNVAAMDELAADPDFGSAFLGGQNHIALFAKAAPKIDMSNISPYDQGLNEEFQKAMKDYFDGNVSKDKALENFYTAAIEKYPNLKKPA